MILNFQNKLPQSRDMTILFKRSLQNRKKAYLNANNILFSHLISTGLTFLESSYHDLSNDVLLASIR